MSLDYSDEALAERFSVSRESLQKLRDYQALLIKWQKAINIVSPASLDDAWARHFVDSLQLLSFIPAGVRHVVDLGSGGGFPGMVLTIARGDLNIALVDSDKRKMQFLKTVSRETSTPVQIYAERVENVLVDIPVDMITARGFASLDVILELAWPAIQINPDLQLLLLKGERAQKEIDATRTDFSFDCTLYESVTHTDASVLLISNVRKLA